jgi:two-component sensor histidine kinase
MAQPNPVAATSSRDLPSPWLFVAEMGHRIANEYAFMIASISLAASKSPNLETKAALADVSEHLLDYAEVHRALQPPLGAAPVELSSYLQRLCSALVRATLNRRGIKLTLLEDEVELDPARCWRVGLIVAELINNALKHGFDVGGGVIVVEVKTQGGAVCCRVTDDGRASLTAIPGRGSQIVDALAAELGGRIQRTFTELGSTILLSFPADADDRPAVVLRTQEPWGDRALSLDGEVSR